MVSVMAVQQSVDMFLLARQTAESYLISDVISMLSQCCLDSLTQIFIQRFLSLLIVAFICIARCLKKRDEVIKIRKMKIQSQNFVSRNMKPK